MTRRSEVQRCPAVPTAENTIARTAMSRSAEGATIIALLPPSSRIGRPKRDATFGPTIGRVRAEALQRAFEDFHRRQRGERRLLGRLPDHGIAADQRQRRVPRPDCDREIEGGDDRAWPKRMPGFGHAMARTLRGDGEAVQLAREADREVADVDHLLYFAQALGDDLADFEGHQRAQG